MIRYCLHAPYKLGLLTVVGLSFFLHSPAFSSDTKTSPLWSQRMRTLESSLSDLLHDLSSEKPLRGAELQRVQKRAETLSSTVHDLRTMTAKPDADPTLALLAKSLNEQLDHGLSALRQGKPTYARQIFRTIPGYCIACHARNPEGPQFSANWDRPFVKKLRGIEKGDYFAAVRQFDRSLSEYEKVAQETKLPFEQERALRSALAIAVRVKNDPAAAEALLEASLKNSATPFFLREQIAQWKKSVSEWKKEGTSISGTAEQRLERAKNLIVSARKSQAYPADHAADVVYHRAISLLHSALAAKLPSLAAAEALDLLGVAHEVLQEPYLWESHELYYLACIREAPHTLFSRRCYSRYEQSVLLGYTGSAGTDVPVDVRKRLDELELLSAPLPTEKPKPQTLH